MSIVDVTSEKANYDAEMVAKFPPPILRAYIISTYMEKVIEVLTALETSIDTLDTKIDALDIKIDALEARVEALEG